MSGLGLFLPVLYYPETCVIKQDVLCTTISISPNLQENGHSSMYTWILSTGWWVNRAAINPDAVVVIGFLCTCLIGGFVYINRFVNTKYILYIPLLFVPFEFKFIFISMASLYHSCFFMRQSEVCKVHFETIISVGKASCSSSYPVFYVVCKPDILG